MELETLIARGRRAKRAKDQRDVAFALCTLSISADHHVKMVKKGVCEALKTILMTSKDKLALRYTCVTLSNLACDTENQETMPKLGILPLLIKSVLDIDDQDSFVLAYASLVVANLLSHRHNIREVISLGGCEVLVKLLYCKNPYTGAYVARAIVNLGTSTEAREKLVKLNVVPLLIELACYISENVEEEYLEEDDFFLSPEEQAKINLCALSALRVLCIDYETRHIFVKNGGIDALILLEKGSNSLALKIEVASAFCALSAIVENRRDICDNALATILNLAVSNEEIVASKCAETISNLLENEDLHPLIVSERGIPILLSLLSIPHDQTQRYASRGLALLSSTTKRTCGGNENTKKFLYQQMIYEEGGLLAIIEGVRSKSRFAIHNCCLALGNFWQMPHYVTNSLELGGANAVLESASLDDLSSGLAAAIAYSLSVLAGHSETHPFLLENNLLSALFKLSTVTGVESKRFIALALSNLATNTLNHSFIVERGGLQPLLCILEISDEQTVTYCLQGLKGLSSTTELVPSLLSGGTLDTILRDFSHRTSSLNLSYVSELLGFISNILNVIDVIEFTFRLISTTSVDNLESQGILIFFENLLNFTVLAKDANVERLILLVLTKLTHEKKFLLAIVKFQALFEFVCDKISSPHILIQREALLFIANSSSHAPILQVYKEKGLYPMIMAFSQTQNFYILRCCLLSLMNATFSIGLLDLLVKLDLTQLIRDMLMRGSIQEDMIHMCLITLVNISSESSYHEKLVSLGIIEILTEIAGSTPTIKSKMLATHVLIRLSENSVNLKDIAERGSIQPILWLCSYPSLPMFKIISPALDTLCSTQDYRRLIIKSTYIDSIHSLISSHFDSREKIKGNGFVAGTFRILRKLSELENAADIFIRSGLASDLISISHEMREYDSDTHLDLAKMFASLGSDISFQSFIKTHDLLGFTERTFNSNIIKVIPFALIIFSNLCINNKFTSNRDFKKVLKKVVAIASHKLNQLVKQLQLTVSENYYVLGTTILFANIMGKGNSSLLKMMQEEIKTTRANCVELVLKSQSLQNNLAGRYFLSNFSTLDFKDRDCLYEVVPLMAKACLENDTEKKILGLNILVNLSKFHEYREIMLLANILSIIQTILTNSGVVLNDTNLEIIVKTLKLGLNLSRSSKFIELAFDDGLSLEVWTLLSTHVSSLAISKKRESLSSEFCINGLSLLQRLFITRETNSTNNLSFDENFEFIKCLFDAQGKFKKKKIVLIELMKIICFVCNGNITHDEFNKLIRLLNENIAHVQDYQNCIELANMLSVAIGNYFCQLEDLPVLSQDLRELIYLITNKMTKDRIIQRKKLASVWYFLVLSTKFQSTTFYLHRQGLFNKIHIFGDALIKINQSDDILKLCILAKNAFLFQSHCELFSPFLQLTLRIIRMYRYSALNNNTHLMIMKECCSFLEKYSENESSHSICGEVGLLEDLFSLLSFEDNEILLLTLRISSNLCKLVSLREEFLKIGLLSRLITLLRSPKTPEILLLTEELSTVSILIDYKTNVAHMKRTGLISTLGNLLAKSQVPKVRQLVLQIIFQLSLYPEMLPKLKNQLFPMVIKLFNTEVKLQRFLSLAFFVNMATVLAYQDEMLHLLLDVDFKTDKSFTQIHFKLFSNFLCNISLHPIIYSQYSSIVKAFLSIPATAKLLQDDEIALQYTTCLRNMTCSTVFFDALHESDRISLLYNFASEYSPTVKEEAMISIVNLHLATLNPKSKLKIKSTMLIEFLCSQNATHQLFSLLNLGSVDHSHQQKQDILTASSKSFYSSSLEAQRLFSYLVLNLLSDSSLGPEFIHDTFLSHIEIICSCINCLLCSTHHRDLELATSASKVLVRNKKISRSFNSYGVVKSMFQVLNRVKLVISIKVDILQVLYLLSNIIPETLLSRSKADTQLLIENQASSILPVRSLANDVVSNLVLQDTREKIVLQFKPAYESLKEHVALLFIMKFVIKKQRYKLDIGQDFKIRIIVSDILINIKESIVNDPSMQNITDKIIHSSVKAIVSNRLFNINAGFVVEDEESVVKEEIDTVFERAYECESKFVHQNLDTKMKETCKSALCYQGEVLDESKFSILEESIIASLKYVICIISKDIQVDVPISEVQDVTFTLSQMSENFEIQNLCMVLLFNITLRQQNKTNVDIKHKLIKNVYIKMKPNHQAELIFSHSSTLLTLCSKEHHLQFFNDDCFVIKTKVHAEPSLTIKIINLLRSIDIKSRAFIVEKCFDILGNLFLNQMSFAHLKNKGIFHDMIIIFKQVNMLNQKEYLTCLSKCFHFQCLLFQHEKINVIEIEFLEYIRTSFLFFNTQPSSDWYLVCSKYYIVIHTLLLRSELFTSLMNSRGEEVSLVTARIFSLFNSLFYEPIQLLDIHGKKLLSILLAIIEKLIFPVVKNEKIAENIDFDFVQNVLKTAVLQETIYASPSLLILSSLKFTQDENVIEDSSLVEIINIQLKNTDLSTRINALVLLEQHLVSSSFMLTFLEVKGINRLTWLIHAKNKVMTYLVCRSCCRISSTEAMELSNEEICLISKRMTNCAFRKIADEHKEDIVLIESAKIEAFQTLLFILEQKEQKFNLDLLNQSDIYDAVSLTENSFDVLVLSHRFLTTLVLSNHKAFGLFSNKLFIEVLIQNCIQTKYPLVAREALVLCQALSKNKLLGSQIFKENSLFVEILLKNVVFKNLKNSELLTSTIEVAVQYWVHQSYKVNSRIVQLALEVAAQSINKKLSPDFNAVYKHLVNSLSNMFSLATSDQVETYGDWIGAQLRIQELLKVPLNVDPSRSQLCLVKNIYKFLSIELDKRKQFNIPIKNIPSISETFFAASNMALVVSKNFEKYVLEGKCTKRQQEVLISYHKYVQYIVNSCILRHEYELFERVYDVIKTTLIPRKQTHTLHSLRRTCFGILGVASKFRVYHQLLIESRILNLFKYAIHTKEGKLMSSALTCIANISSTTACAKALVKQNLHCTLGFLGETKGTDLRNTIIFLYNVSKVNSLFTFLFNLKTTYVTHKLRDLEYIIEAVATEEDETSTLYSIIEQLDGLDMQNDSKNILLLAIANLFLQKRFRTFSIKKGILKTLLKKLNDPNTELENICLCLTNATQDLSGQRILVLLGIAREIKRAIYKTGDSCTPLATLLVNLSANTENQNSILKQRFLEASNQQFKAIYFSNISILANLNEIGEDRLTHMVIVLLKYFKDAGTIEEKLLVISAIRNLTKHTMISINLILEELQFMNSGNTCLTARINFYLSEIICDATTEGDIGLLEAISISNLFLSLKHTLKVIGKNYNELTHRIISNILRALSNFGSSLAEIKDISIVQEALLIAQRSNLLSQDWKIHVLTIIATGLDNPNFRHYYAQNNGLMKSVQLYGSLNNESVLLPWINVLNKIAEINTLKHSLHSSKISSVIGILLQSNDSDIINRVIKLWNALENDFECINIFRKIEVFRSLLILLRQNQFGFSPCLQIFNIINISIDKYDIPHSAFKYIQKLLERFSEITDLIRDNVIVGELSISLLSTILKIIAKLCFFDEIKEIVTCQRYLRLLQLALNIDRREFTAICARILATLSCKINIARSLIKVPSTRSLIAGFNSSTQQNTVWIFAFASILLSNLFVIEYLILNSQHVVVYEAIMLHNKFERDILDYKVIIHHSISLKAHMLERESEFLSLLHKDVKSICALLTKMKDEEIEKKLMMALSQYSSNESFLKKLVSSNVTNAYIKKALLSKECDTLCRNATDIILVESTNCHFNINVAEVLQIVARNIFSHNTTLHTKITSTLILANCCFHMNKDLIFSKVFARDFSKELFMMLQVLKSTDFTLIETLIVFLTAITLGNEKNKDLLATDSMITALSKFIDSGVISLQNRTLCCLCCWLNKEEKDIITPSLSNAVISEIVQCLLEQRNKMIPESLKIQQNTKNLLLFYLFGCMCECKAFRNAIHAHNNFRIFDSLVFFLERTTIFEIQACVLCALCQICQEHELREICSTVSEDIKDMLIEVLTKYLNMKSPHLQLYSAHALAHFAQIKSFHKRFRDNNTISGINHLICNSKEPKYFACLALLVLAQNYRNHLAIIEKGGIQALVRIAKSSFINKNLKYKATKQLSEIAGNMVEMARSRDNENLSRN